MLFLPSLLPLVVGSQGAGSAQRAKENSIMKTKRGVFHPNRAQQATDTGLVLPAQTSAAVGKTAP